MINKALSNVQIKTDILTVEKLYRPSHEYGFLRETDTVKDYLTWFVRIVAAVSCYQSTSGRCWRCNHERRW